MGRAFDIIRPRHVHEQEERRGRLEKAAKILDEPAEYSKNHSKKFFRFGGILEFVILVAIITVLATYFGKAVKSTLPLSGITKNEGLPTLSTENIQDNTSKNKDASQTAQAQENGAAGAEAVAITKGNAKVKVLNGAGVSSLAAETRTKLSKAGFNVTSIGNAKNKYTSTYVYYKSGAQGVAEEIGQVLEKSSPKIQESSVAQEHDVIVVMGSQ